MSKLFISSILVLAFCTTTFAQTDKNLSCPTLDVTGPAEIQSPDEPMVLTAALSKEAEKFDLKYKLTVSNGDLIEGHDALIVKVLMKDIKKALTATIEIIGLPKECPNKGSVAVSIYSMPDSTKVNEFSIFVF